jgi:hypothetical protein
MKHSICIESVANGIIYYSTIQSEVHMNTTKVFGENDTEKLLNTIIIDILKGNSYFQDFIDKKTIKLTVVDKEDIR